MLLFLCSLMRSFVDSMWVVRQHWDLMTSIIYCKIFTVCSQCLSLSHTLIPRATCCRLTTMKTLPWHCRWHSLSFDYTSSTKVLLINVFFCEFLSMLQCAVNNCSVLASYNIPLVCTFTSANRQKVFTVFLCYLIANWWCQFDAERCKEISWDVIHISRWLNQRNVCKNLRISTDCSRLSLGNYTHSY